jgi:IS5 family transposase
VASGFAERENALAMLAELPGTKPRTVGADKAYDTAEFIARAREIQVTPHVAQNTGRPSGSAIDGRTTRHPGYEASQCLRKRVEEPFGWAKTVGRIRQTVFRGLERVNMQFLLTMTANNLVRMRGLLAGAT